MSHLTMKVKVARTVDWKTEKYYEAPPKWPCSSSGKSGISDNNKTAGETPIARELLKVRYAQPSG